MSFIYTNKGHINTRFVISIDESKVLYLVGDEICEARGYFSGGYAHLIDAPTIPAEPGWTLVGFSSEQNAAGEYVEVNDPWYEPIIAWRIEGTAAHPVTITDDADLRNRGIRNPNSGEITDSGGNTYKTVADFFKDRQRQKAAEKAPPMTAKAGVYTYAQYIAGGWTHEQLIERGYIAS